MLLTQNNDLSPIWNEHFEFIVEDVSTQHLTVKIYDDDGVQAADLIGCAQVGLKELEPGKVKDIWVKLVKDLEIQRDNKNRGQVYIYIFFSVMGMCSNALIKISLVCSSLAFIMINKVGN
jgi:Ca2+-dependent lipid-binding protein